MFRGLRSIPSITDFFFEGALSDHLGENRDGERNQEKRPAWMGWREVFAHSQKPSACANYSAHGRGNCCAPPDRSSVHGSDPPSYGIGRTSCAFRFRHGPFSRGANRKVHLRRNSVCNLRHTARRLGLLMVNRATWRPADFASGSDLPLISAPVSPASLRARPNCCW